MAQQLWLHRSLWVVLLLVLPACEHNLAVTPIEAKIQADLKQRGQLPVQSISCPSDVKLAVGKSFDCVGELEPSGTFFVTVTQENDRGQVRWEVPSSWSLLNLNQLESEFEQKLKIITKASPNVDCGGVYRPTKPGDSFECKLVQSTTKGRPAVGETIVVKVEPAGKVTWQEIRIVAAKPSSIVSSASNSTLPTPDVAPSSSPSSSNRTSSSEVTTKDATGWTQLND
jgi:hypothetical protein